MALTKVSYSMIQGAVANVLDFGASPSASASANATAIQAAIDSGAKRVYIPAGDYSVDATIVASNKAGFVLEGEGMLTSLSWTGTAGGTIFRMRGSWFSTITNIWFNCNSSADTSVDLPCFLSGTDTNVPIMNSFEHCRFGGTRVGTGTGVVIGDGVGTQLDNLNFYKCWFENAGKLASITGTVTLHINFDNCVFSAFNAIPTTVGVDLISGGLINFVSCQFVGSAPTIAYIRRSITALSMNFKDCEMESDGAFLNCPDDTAFANTLPITLIGCVLGCTGTGVNIIDYRQRGALIIQGGRINATGASFVNHQPPATGLLNDVGVSYVNVTVTPHATSLRTALKADGTFSTNATNGNLIGAGNPASGVIATVSGSSTDATLVRTVAHQGGSGAGGSGWGTATQNQQTTATVSTGATAIAAVEQNHNFVIVAGIKSDNSAFFTDLVLTSNTNGSTPTVIGANASGSPSARTYDVASFNLRLAMASDTYRVNCHFISLTSR